MFYLFLSIVGVLAIGVYVTMIFQLVPGAKDERLGVLEALPPDLGVWKADTSPGAETAETKGLTRQIRVLHQPAAGWLGSEKLIRQVRYRDNATGEIVRVEPEEVTRRRRIRR